MTSLSNRATLIFFIFNIIVLATTPSFADAIYTNELPYDHVSLNSNTWQEVDMIYYPTINGKRYLNTINLLRPKAYLAQHHINQVGQKLTLTLPGIGLNHNIVTITAIKPTTQFKVCHQSNCSQVIGLFKHYATDVKTYRFKDLMTGNISTIHATPNHPFYVKNKHQFLPISEVTVNDQLVGESNHIIKLICATNQIDHCGGNYNNQKSILVYNLEVYQQHNYRVSTDSILVHNCNQLTASQEYKIQKRLNKTKWRIIQPDSESDSLDNTIIITSKDQKNYGMNRRFGKLQRSESIFTNGYSKERWDFYANFRNPKSPYYRSDVVYAQAKLVFGDHIPKPDIFFSHDIINSEAVDFLTKNIPDGGLMNSEMMESYLTSTPVGKSSRHILDMFGWKAKKIEVVHGEIFGLKITLF